MATAMDPARIPTRDRAEYLSPPIQRRPRRLTSPGRATDLFLELAKDVSDNEDTVSHVGSTVSRRNTSLASDRLRTSTTNVAKPARSVSSAMPPRPSRVTQSSPEQVRPLEPSTLASDPKYTESYSPTVWAGESVPITPPYTDGVDSVGSMTAASPIWDDAEDLKDRMARYRSRRVTSSGATMEGSTDRPRTATTMTTNSTSSRLLHMQPETKTVQLLQTALSRTKDIVDPAVYEALHSCASDAIAAALLADSGRDSASIVGSSSDRKLKRTVDSLCQSLTELCIALRQSGDISGTRLVHSRQTERPESRVSVWPQEHYSPSNYLEERRARLERIGSTSRPSSSLSKQTTRTAYTDRPERPLQSRYRRSSTTEPESPRITKANTIFSQDSEDRDSTIRAPSRAATDILFVTSPQSPRRNKKKSRDYTDQSPLPETTSPSLNKRFPTNYANTSHVSFSSSAVTDGDRLRRNERAEHKEATGIIEERLDAHRKLKEKATTDTPADSPPTMQRSRKLFGFARRPHSSGNSGLK